jgi:hypothetical protein
VPLTGKGTVKYIRGVIGVAGPAQFWSPTYLCANQSTTA